MLECSQTLAVAASKNGFRQGDVPACLLFSIGLEKVVRVVNIQTKGTVTCICG
jgi:hypothetical protein